MAVIRATVASLSGPILSPCSVTRCYCLLWANKW